MPVSVAARIRLEVLHRELRDRFPIAREHGLERLDLLEFRFLFHQRWHAFQAIHHLGVHRVLDPQRAVLVEGGDAILGRDILGIRLVSYRLDECQDGLLSGAVVPRWQWVLGVGEGLADECDQQQGEPVANEIHGEFSLLLKGGRPLREPPVP